MTRRTIAWLVLLFAGLSVPVAAQRGGKDEPPVYLTLEETHPVGRTPAELQWTGRDSLWVACQYDTTLVKLDVDSGRVEESVRLSPISPLGFHVDRSEREAVVCNYAGPTLHWVNLKSGEVEETLELELKPVQIEVAKDGRKAVVACSESQSLYFVDLKSRSVRGEPAILNGTPHTMIFDRSERNVYVACGGGCACIALIPYGANVGGFWEAPLIDRSPLWLEPEGKHVLGAGKDSLLFLHAAGGGMDPGTGDVLAESRAIPGRVHAMESIQRGKLLLLLFGLEDSIGVLDRKSWEIVQRIPTGKSPAAMALSPDGKRLAVANRSGGTVSIYSVAR